LVSPLFILAESRAGPAMQLSTLFTPGVQQARLQLILSGRYEGGGIVFGVMLLLFLLQYIAQRRLPRNTARAVQGIALLIATAGLWLTYSDFRSDFTHNILRERFHLGAYLFWVGWISISLYMFATARLQRVASKAEVEGLQ
jgi:hypothetical protein